MEKPAPQVFAMLFARKVEMPTNTEMDPSWSTGANGHGDQDD